MRRDCFFGGQSVYWHLTEYDLLNRPTNATDSVSLVREWLYNRRSELAAATIGADHYDYAYDSIGNRLWSAANVVTNSYTANRLNQYMETTHPCTSLQTRAGMDGGVTDTVHHATRFAYDADGNMTGDGRFSYAYDAENRLVSVTSAMETNGAIRVLNAYDPRNRRIRKTVHRLHSTLAPPSPEGAHEWETQETHTFVWDGSNIVLEKVEFADGTARTFEYFWGADKSGSEQGAGGVGGLLAVSMDGVFYIPCYDHNGNIVLYVSEAGSIAAQYTYDPYGNIVDSSGNLADVFSFGFSTKYHDRETGMVAYQRRFYRPDLGRWLNRDPIEEEGGENLYAFCGNNPISLLDKFGMDIWVENTTAVYGYHQRVCVTVWTRNDKSTRCCNGVGYSKSGKYCISFGIVRTGNEDSTDSYSGDGGSSDSDSPGNSSTSADEAAGATGKSPFPQGFDGPNPNGDGRTYPDNNDPSTGIAFFLSTGDNPCTDIEILNYMEGLVGQNANYSIVFQNCRSFSQAVFNKYKKESKK